MTGSFEPGPSVHVTGNVSGQVAAGTFVYQVQAPGGVVNQIVVKEPIKARPLPCLLRPRRLPVPIGRDYIIAQAITASKTDPIQFHAHDGWGKSTVLKHLAYDSALEEWRDGVVFLSGYGRPIEDVEQDLFDAFYESVLPDARVRATPSQLRASLRNVSAVVLVDDADLGSQHLERLLDDAPQCAFMLSSSERSLNVATHISIDGLTEADAMVLFERGLGRALTDAEGNSVARFAEVCHGQPQAVLIAAAAVRRAVIAVDDLANLHNVEQVVAALRRGLDPNEVRVLELLAAVGGTPLPANAVEEVTGDGNAEGTLERLRGDGLVLAASPRFRLSAPAIVGLGDTDAVIRERQGEVLWGLVRWARRVDDPEELVLAGPAMIALAEELSARAPEQVVELARVAHAGLAVTGQWGMWSRLLEAALQAATAAGDRASSAWALHEIGTHALLVGNREVAARRLEDSLRIREMLGDEVGARVTRHNLRTLRSRPHHHRWRRVVITGVVVIAILVVAVVLYMLLSDSNHAGALTIGVREIDFGEVPTGEVREARVSLTNQGDGAVDVTSIAIDSPFAIEHNCGHLVSNSGCEVRVIFSAPATSDSYESDLTIEHDDDDGGATVSRIPVRGESVAPVTVSLDVQPPLVDFGLVPLGGSAAEQVVTVSNRGDAIADVALSLEGDDVFNVSHDCGSLQPGQSCSAGVQLVPAEPGEFTATLHVEHAGGDPVDVPITGVVPPPPETTGPRAVIEVDPRAFDFGQVLFSDGVVTRSVVISNTGTASADLTTSLDDGSVFAVAQSCERIEPTSKCEVIVKFAASESGEFADTLHIEPADGDAFDLPVSASVPTAPDLAAEIVDAGDAIIEESGDVRYWVLPITVVISNSGEAPAGDPFRLTVETGSTGEPILLPVWDGKGPISGMTVDPPIDAGEKRQFEVDIALDRRSYSEEQDVDVRVVVDSCVGERSLEVPPCRIVEEHETNNVSADFTVHIPTIVE